MRRSTSVDSVASLLIGSAVVLAISTLAHADFVQFGPDWKEGNSGSGDAGALPSSAQVPITAAPFPAMLRTISGALSQFIQGPPDQQDVYAIYIDSPVIFTATTDVGVDALASTSFNSQLFLFNSLGLPVVANDGVGDGATVMLPTFALVPGIYYIAISLFNSDPLDSGSVLLFPDLVGPSVLPSNIATPASWTSSPFSGGDYTIGLTGAVFVPAPGALLMILLGVVPVGLGRRRR